MSANSGDELKAATLFGDAAIRDVNPPRPGTARIVHGEVITRDLIGLYKKHVNGTAQPSIWVRWFDHHNGLEATFRTLVKVTFPQPIAAKDLHAFTISLEGHPRLAQFIYIPEQQADRYELQPWEYESQGGLSHGSRSEAFKRIWVELTSPRGGEIDALRVMVYARQIRELYNRDDGWLPALTLFAHWCLHPELTGTTSRSAKAAELHSLLSEFVSGVEDPAADHAPFPERVTELNTRVNEVLSLAHLRRDLIELTKLHPRLPADVFRSASRWHAFVKVLFSEISEKPLGFPRDVQTLAPGKARRQEYEKAAARPIIIGGEAVVVSHVVPTAVAGELAWRLSLPGARAFEIAVAMEPRTAFDLP